MLSPSTMLRTNSTKHPVPGLRNEMPRSLRSLRMTGVRYGEGAVRQNYVYIMTNRSRTLYTGVTSNLERRVYEHKQRMGSKFTSKYNITQLAYYEECSDTREAIAREKQIKGWLRAKKIALIESVNPEWKDLSAEWYE